LSLASCTAGTLPYMFGNASKMPANKTNRTSEFSQAGYLFIVVAS